MKQALCAVRNQATLVTHKVCGMRRPSACKPRPPRPLPQALPELPLPFTAQVGLSGPSHETCSGHSPADITLCLCRVCAQSCLCSPMDCSPQGSSVHGVFQASILVWVATFSSRPKDGTRVSYVSCVGRWVLYH